MPHNSDPNRGIYDLVQACDYLSSGVEGWINQHTQQNGHAGFVLTGGKSITGFFDAFKKMDVNWGQVSLFLSDDRLVPDTDPASNEKQLKEMFLNEPKIGSQARYLSIKNSQEPTQDILESSVAILSMGLDGHVASLFSTDDLQGAGYLTYVSRPDYERVSLSYETLKGIGKKYIVVYGDQKIDFFRKINMHEFYLRDLFLSSEVVLVKG
jgi:6-phosphogluconolactonase